MSREERKEKGSSSPYIELALRFSYEVPSSFDGYVKKKPQVEGRVHTCNSGHVSVIRSSSNGRRRLSGS